MASAFDSPRNLSFYAVPAAWFISIAPRFYASYLYRKTTKRAFPNKCPRTFVSEIAAEQGIDAATRGRIIRAECAQANGFENIGLFAAAVVAGNFAGLESGLLNRLTGTYLALRVLYNFIYVQNETALASTARTVTFVSGASVCWTLFVLAGNKLATKARL